MKFLSLRTILAILLAGTWVLSSATFAANQCGGVIHFAKGKSSILISGKVVKDGICTYHFYAKKGQALTVNMGKHDRPQAFLYSPVEKDLTSGQAFILPQNGRYELRVGMTRNDARKYSAPQPFTMNFSIQSIANGDTQKANIATSGFAGHYHSVLPCLTCNGIDTELMLNQDGSYRLSEQYLGHGRDVRFTQQGNWMVYGPAIVLQPQDKEDKTLYLIAQNGDVYFVSQQEAGAAQPKIEADHRLKRD